jgi:hypothetical protein
MWGGEPIKTDPEVAVATAATDGGDEVRSGSAPGVPQQSVAEVGQMMPREPPIKVLTKAEIVHYVDRRTEVYRTTEVNFKAIAVIQYPSTEIKIARGNYIRDELYNMEPDYLEKLIKEAVKDAVNDAVKFVNKRNELYELFEKLGVKAEFERIEKEDDC